MPHVCESLVRRLWPEATPPDLPLNSKQSGSTNAGYDLEMDDKQTQVRLVG